MNTNFDAKITAYLEHIKQDYASWQNQTTKSDPIAQKIRQEMTERFNESIRVERGSKYLKVVANGGAHSFIVIKPDAKFKFGDILKPASWAAPAKNFSRGNVELGNFGNVTWTGAH